MRRRGLERAVSALLRDRRPRRFRATEDEAAQLRTAALLRAARAGADLPTERFVRDLEGRLRAEVAATAGDAPDAPHAGAQSRRTFLVGAGIATAAAAGIGIGVEVERLTSDGTPAGLGDQERLVPDGARWVAVAGLDAVRAVPALRVSAGAVEAVLVPRADGGVDALSAVCTHLGCLLRVDAAAGHLACPCHRAVFALDGTPRSEEYLRSLPRLDARVRNGTVEIRVA